MRKIIISHFFVIKENTKHAGLQLVAILQTLKIISTTKISARLRECLDWLVQKDTRSSSQQSKDSDPDKNNM